MHYSADIKFSQDRPFSFINRDVLLKTGVSERSLNVDCIQSIYHWGFTNSLRIQTA